MVTQIVFITMTFKPGRYSSNELDALHYCIYIRNFKCKDNAKYVNKY